MKCPKCHFDNQDDSRYCSKCATPLISSKDISVSRTKTIRKFRKELGTGSTIAGKYEICEELGKGGMGVVYKAEDIKLSRMVAIKLLPSELTDDLEARERFVHEARAASALDHPNICTIYEIDETEEGQIFIAMAFYSGRTLKKKIKQGPLSIKETIDIVIQVAQGLSKAHSKGIVHRDIKPANVMIGEDGVVKIVDFGLAKLAGGAQLTRTSEIMGTVAYMSPEQASGESVDQRTDIWSLGVMFYELLTGELPFKGENERSLMYSIMNKSPIPSTELKRDVPKEADRIFFKCLRKKVDDRYQFPSRLLSDLTKLKNVLEKEKEDIVEKKKKPEVKKETERRHATIMFAEVAEYNEMLERMDEEEVASIMNSCFEMFGPIVRKYGGTIDERTENSMKVLFGIPVAIEDAPKEAINAAIEIRNKLHQFNQKKNIQVPLDIHIGINTGTVIAGGIGMEGEKDYTVMGDTVTIASRLKDLSAKGEIYVSPSTYRYTRNKFDYKPLKPITLKGKTEPFPIFVLLSTREKIYRPKLGSERMIYSEMVGRDKELDGLKLHVLKVINGEGSIVNVIGEAGIGKSRLIAELKRIEDLKKVTLFEGRALSVGRNLSYHPVIDILKNWATIKEEDTETEAIFKLEKAISNIYPEGAGEVFPFIATLMGMKLTGKHADRVKGIEGEALEKLILKSMRELMIKVAEIRPVVTIIEDLHWADISSIELLESLFRLAEGHRILFFNVFRPNYEETGDRILETVKDRYSNIHSETSLKPLDERQCEVLIQNLIKVRSISTDVREAIINRTEGNPFFIEEVVRSFIDDGVVEIQDGRFRVTEKIDSVVIPETVHEVLMARIDKLDEDSRSLLKVASVIGRNFFYKILADVAKGDEEIDDRLELLKEVQLIKERRRMKELEYLFKHALAWDAVYNSILLKKRSQLHLDVARSIESVFSERLHEFYGMLALHYSRGENLEKSEEYLIKAGEEALKTAASSEALNYFQEALSLYLKKHGDAGDPEKISRLEKSIALALYNKGHYAESLKYLDNVLDYLGVKRPKNKLVSVINLLLNLSNVLLNLYIPRKKKNLSPTAKDNEVADLMYKRGEALSSLDRTRFFMDSIGLIRRLNKLDLSGIENGTTHYAASSALFSVSGISFPISKKMLDYSSSFIDKRDKKSLFRINVYQLLHDYLAGNWDKDLEYNQSLIDHMLNIGDLFLTRIQLVWSGLIKLEQGNFNDVSILVEKLNEIGEEYEHDGAISSKYSLNAILLLKKRQLYDALEEASKGIDVQKSMYKIHHLLEMLAVKINMLIILKDIDAAANSLIEAKELISREKHITPYYMAHFLLSQFLFDLCLFEESIKSNEESKISKLRKKTSQSGKAAIKNAMKYAANKTEVFRYKGVYYWLVGKQKKAVRWWRKSINIGKELQALPELARTYMEIGKRLMEKKSKFKQIDGKEYKWYLNESEKIFKKLNLEWDIEEISKLRSFEGDK